MVQSRSTKRTSMPSAVSAGTDSRLTAMSGVNCLSSRTPSLSRPATSTVILTVPQPSTGMRRPSPSDTLPATGSNLSNIPRWLQKCCVAAESTSQSLASDWPLMPALWTDADCSALCSVPVDTIAAAGVSAGAVCGVSALSDMATPSSPSSPSSSRTAQWALDRPRRRRSLLALDQSPLGSLSLPLPDSSSDCCLAAAALLLSVLLLRLPSFLSLFLPPFLPARRSLTKSGARSG